MSTAVCVAENLVISDDGKLRLAPWSAPRNVVDVIAASGGDTTKLLEHKTLPGRLLIDKLIKWTNDSPVDHTIRVEVHRRYRHWITSNPNAVQFRDRWSWAITAAGDEFVVPAEPNTADTFNGQVGSAGDIGTNTVAEPFPGKYWHWWGTTATEEWLGPLAPGETMGIWYRMYVWTPPPFSNNANKNSPTHSAEAGWARIAMQAFPKQGKLVTG